MSRDDHDPTQQFSTSSRVELIDAIVSHFHEQQYDQMDVLSEKLFEVQKTHGARWDDLVGRIRPIWEELVRQLSSHFRREETILFPLLSVPDDEIPPLDGPIADIIEEHVQEAALLQRLYDVTGGYVVPSDACELTRDLMMGLADFDASVRRHIAVEDRLLFEPLRSN